jgi:cell division control protein 45
MSYAITALLECNTATVLDLSDQQPFLDAFNVAYDALNPKSSSVSVKSEGTDLSTLVNGGDLSGNAGLGAGIRWAISLQQLIFSTAINLVNKNAIVRLSHFRYAYLTTSSSKSARSGTDTSAGMQYHIFSRPLALCKLATFLMDMHRENGKWVGSKARPLILMAERPETNTYVVVGYNYDEEEGDVHRNRFGKSFELAANTIRGRVAFDTTSWDANVCEVESSVVQRFIEQLHYLMDAK